MVSTAGRIEEYNMIAIVQPNVRLLKVIIIANVALLDIFVNNSIKETPASANETTEITLSTGIPTNIKIIISSQYAHRNQLYVSPFSSFCSVKLRPHLHSHIHQDWVPIPYGIKGGVGVVVPVAELFN